MGDVGQARCDGGPRVALEVSGHLREACARADGRPALAKAVAECRRFAHCDIFLHTWSTLNAATAVWHHNHFGADDSSSTCVAQLQDDATLRPTALAVSEQAPNGCRIGGVEVHEGWRWNEVAVAKAPRWGRSGAVTALSGLRCAVLAVERATELRRAHERRTGVEYAAVVRMRPDLFRRTHNKSGLIAVEAPRAPFFAAMARAEGEDGAAGASAAEKLDHRVYGCDSRLPGNAKGDQCFGGQRASMDRVLNSWAAIIDEALAANVCHQPLSAERRTQLAPLCTPRVRQSDFRLFNYPESALGWAINASGALRSLPPPPPRLLRSQPLPSRPSASAALSRASTAGCLRDALDSGALATPAAAATAEPPRPSLSAQTQARANSTASPLVGAPTLTPTTKAAFRLGSPAPGCVAFHSQHKAAGMTFHTALIDASGLAHH